MCVGVGGGGASVGAGEFSDEPGPSRAPSSLQRVAALRSRERVAKLFTDGRKRRAERSPSPLGRRRCVDDGTRWRWMNSPPPNQTVRRAEEDALFRHIGYEESVGQPPVRPLVARFITVAEHLAALNVRSRVTYPLPRNHRYHQSLAVEVVEEFARDEFPGRSSGLYAVEYPEANLPFRFPSRAIEERCFEDFVNSPYYQLREDGQVEVLAPPAARSLSPLSFSEAGKLDRVLNKICSL